MELETYSIWWLDENIKWSEIGADVVSRPTEIEAFNNISTQTKYINGLYNNKLEFSKEEIELMKLDKYINSEDFIYDKGVYRKDDLITKLCKLSGYSEKYIRRLLKSISYKIYLKEVLGINKIIDNRYYMYSKKKYFENKLNKYKRVI